MKLAALFEKGTLQDNLPMLIFQLTRKCGNPIKHGKARLVFERGKMIIKVPRNEHGVEYNYQEKQMFDASMNDSEHPARIYANCDLVHMFEIPVLVIEKISG